MSKAQEIWRRQRNLINRMDLAAMLGVTRHALDYRIENGHIVAPTHKHRNRKFYTVDEAAAIVKEWKA